jgi:hypothetical protein
MGITEYGSTGTVLGFIREVNSAILIFFGRLLQEARLEALGGH